MIFVTGGTGLLGAHLLYRLCDQNESIRAIYRSEQKKDQTLKVFQHYDPENGTKKFNAIEWVIGDILDIPSLTEGMKGCSKVYHCAALVSFHRQDFNQLMKINREGTANMVNVALDLEIDKFCHVSSTAAVGGNELGQSTEDTKWKIAPTTTGYSISKYSAEKEVWRAIEEGLNAVIVNPCVIIGAGNWKDSSLKMFDTLKKGVRHFPPGSNAIVDARDVAEIMVRLMESDLSSERYLCIGSNQSFEVLMKEIAAQLNVKPPSIPAKKYQVVLARLAMSFISLFRSKRSPITKETVNSLFGNRSYSSEKVQSALGFKFRTLKDSIANTIAGRIE